MNSKEKFSNKVDNYSKYRPAYPAEFINYLVNEVGLSQNAVVADIGAGTGILTGLLAVKVKEIYAVEPNYNMRSACRDFCRDLNNCRDIEGSAEDTGLPDHSLDFITVAQAFHWFDRTKTKLEFQRILKPSGKVILVWNSRVAENTFVRENAELFRRLCPNFVGFSGGIGNNPEEFSAFFKDGYCEHRVFENDRLLTLEEYIGSSLSASYAPAESDSNYQAVVEGLTGLFEKYGKDRKIVMPMQTNSYVGEL